RPGPLPERSARRSTVSGPVICPSTSVPSAGSLLLTPTMRVTGAGATASETDAESVTATILWLGGQRTLGEALALANTGPVVSRTVTWNAPVAVFPARSVALALTVVVPIGNVDPEGTLSVTGRSPLSASWAEAEKATIAPAAEVASAVTSV